MTAVVRPARDAIRLVLVDESPAHRALLRRTLQADGDIVVVGEASTFAGAAGAVARTTPDVVALGVSANGGEEAAITRIMRRTPRPILVVGGRDGGPRSVRGRRAIVAGAAAVLASPDRWDAAAEAALRLRVRALRRSVEPVRPEPRPVGPARPVAPAVARTVLPPSQLQEAPRPGSLPPIVAIAASTGGPAAVASVLRDLRDLPAAVILVQHIDHRLVGGFADWLEKASGWRVSVALEGSPPQVGVVNIGPGRWHLELDGRGLFVHRDTPQSIHMPSADRLFGSLAEHAADRVVAAILTGMGADGAAGLLALRHAGARTVAQDERTSAVFGMARAAFELGAVDRLTPLEGIGAAITRLVRPSARSVEG